MMSSQPGRNTRMAPWKRGREKEGERGMERKGVRGRVISSSSILTFHIKYTSGFVLERKTTRFVTSAALVSGSLWSSWVLSSQLIMLPILSRKSSVTG